MASTDKKDSDYYQQQFTEIHARTPEHQRQRKQGHNPGVDGDQQAGTGFADSEVSGYVAEKSDRGYLGGVECESRNREQDQGHPFHKTIFKLLRTNIMHHFTDILACKIS